jgi:hypothetical protein
MLTYLILFHMFDFSVPKAAEKLITSTFYLSRENFFEVTDKRHSLPWKRVSVLEAFTVVSYAQ